MVASTLLDENNATYPEKIFYNNPQHLAVEALELHYRIHASVLKYLELHEGKEISNNLGAFFKKCLNSSTFLRKPAPKVVAQVPAPKVISEIPTTPKVVPEVFASKVMSEIPVKSAENSSLGFQEEFFKFSK
ncbi:hypothetical protein NQ314_014178 [Rhamnusium bicolor]|uniref:Uncharacterized protein n=1 Tax=Rhamnusium bicolor TaxID=1586634 RepID=A0AAV8X3Q6_9CUCU|nr:hypothetical protein NQ314_014178 [Rhamnusium bicolor]